MTRKEKSVSALLIAAAFCAGAAGAIAMQAPRPLAPTLLDGSIVKKISMPAGSASYDVKVVAGDGGKLECVSVPGEKGRRGGGDAGDGLFCGGAVVISPGRAGSDAPH